jgi:CHAT domain-containing protein/tetratricopeptide (TPR) repeat protein
MAFGAALMAAWLFAPPAAAQSTDDLVVKAASAMRGGRTEEVRALNAEIAKARGALPDWAEERRQAASDVPQAKRRAAAMWNEIHRRAILSANGGDAAKAIEEATQALAIAKDNLGDGHLAAIVSAAELATLRRRSGMADAAEAGFRTALESAKASLGDGHPESLKLARSLAAHLRSMAKLDAAVQTQRAAAEAAADALGAKHPLTLALRMDVARSMIEGSHLKEAEKPLDATCADAREAYGEAHGEFSGCVALRGALKRGKGEYDAAATLYDEALGIQKTALAADDPLSLATRVAAAAVRHRQGRLEEARTMLEGVIADAEAANDVSMRLDAIGELIDVLDDGGEYAKAETMAKEALERLTAELGPSHPNALAAMSSLAAIHRKQGRLIEAEKGFREAWERYSGTLGPDHGSTVIAANNLGEILEKEGIYEQAETYLRGALDGSRKAFGETHPATMTAMNNLALLHESQGAFDKAEPLYRSAIAVFSKTIGPLHPDAIASTNNLAYLLMLKGDHELAAAMFRKVRDAWAKAYGPRHQNTLKALNNLARATHRTGMLKEAETLFDQALAARKATLGEKHLDTMRSMRDLAALYRSQKKTKEAEALLRRTLTLNETVLGPAHPYTFETLNTLGETLDDAADAKGAADVRKTIFGRRTEFFNRVLHVTGDNAREGYVRLHQPELAAYVAGLTKLDEAAAGRSLLDVSLNRKGILLKVASEIQQIAGLSQDPELTKLTRELGETRKRLASLTLSGPTEETKNDRVEVINGLEERINVLQGELGRSSARFRRSTAAIGVDDLTKALPANAALVDFIIYAENGKTKMAAGILRKDGDVPAFGLVKYDSTTSIDEAILKYRAMIQNEEIEIDELLDEGQRVHGLIWKPLERMLKSSTKIYAVPDGGLNLLPIGALVEDNRKYLIERIDLHVLTSARDLLPSSVKAASGGYRINAGPDYDADETVDKKALEKARSRSAGSEAQSTMRGFSGMRGLRFDPLPGAEKEGQLIRNTVEAQGRPIVIHSKAEAQEKTLRDMAEPPEILHIATHGFFLKADDTLKKRLLKIQRSGDFQFPPPGDNPLLRAGLAFAGINSNAAVLGDIDTDNDGVLTALEVLGLDLTGTKLAILSACETGLGEIHEGEGVYGLRRAFQEAGAQSVVSSLWEVSDAGTQTLMAALYKRLLAGKTPHDALREAQLEMLRNSQWSAPYIWAAFFMVGG